MSTVWTLDCTNGGSSSEIKVTVPTISSVFSDTWEAAVPAEWDVPGGDALSLGQPEVYLANGTGTPHVLNDFSESTVVGDEGKGTKNALDGTFPVGLFKWECIAKT